MSKNLKRFFSIVLIMATILTLSCQAGQVFAADVKRPEITAESAIVYCQNTGEIVYSRYRNKKIEPFSTTKLMTVLLAVQNLPLDREITISAKAAAQSGSTMNLEEGEILTVEDLIYGALLASANDAAYALGEAVSGDMNTFVKLMNKTADNIGCENTHFTNATGRSAKKHYSTAADMLEIIKVAFSNSIIRNAAGATTYTVEKTNKSKKRTLKTKISFLKNENSGFYAGKTGYWNDSNCCIALGYRQDGLSLLIAVFGDTVDMRSEDVEKLVSYGRDKVEGVKVIGKDKDCGKVRIKHGEKTTIAAYTEEIGYAYLPKEASSKLIQSKIVMYDNVKAPVSAGTVVGTYQIYVADDLVNEINLVVKEDIGEGWFTSYLGISNFAAAIIGAILLLVVALLLAISIARARYRQKKRRLKKQRIMELAMEELRAEQERKERDWRF